MPAPARGRDRPPVPRAPGTIGAPWRPACWSSTTTTRSSTTSSRSWASSAPTRSSTATTPSTSTASGPPPPTPSSSPPGPGRPEDAGVSLAVIDELAGEIPILGVCLGHQAIGQAFGGEVVAGPHPDARQDLGHPPRRARGVRRAAGSLRRPPATTRWWSSRRRVPDVLEVTARTADGVIMGLRHRTLAVEGVQFHPESLLTPEGPVPAGQLPGRRRLTDGLVRADDPAGSARPPPPPRSPPGRRVVVVGSTVVVVVEDRRGRGGRGRRRRARRHGDVDRAARRHAGARARVRRHHEPGRVLGRRAPR